MLLIVNLVDVATLAWRAHHGEVRWADLRPEQVLLLFFQPALLVCVYATLIGQMTTTIRLYCTELVYRTRGFWFSGREAGYARREIVGVDAGWITLTIMLDRPPRFPMRCHRVTLFYGRTRDERERVAAAIRNWIEQTPAELQP